MKYLKRFDERLGISQDMEQQVEGYMKTIRERPISKTFRLLYQCDLVLFQVDYRSKDRF